MQFFKNLIPSIILKFIRPYYHGLMALVASIYYGNPSSKLIVIGVTGTAGKSTTVQMLAWILNHTNIHPHPKPLPEGEGGKRKTGFITTVSFCDGKKEFINKHGLSMPGGWLLQKQLKTMLEHGCKYAIVECTSEGLAQNRHLGIKFDAAVLTNLSPAHIEAHGGFENYRKAKGKLFESLSAKGLGLSIVNGDDDNAEWFLQFEAKKKNKGGFMQHNNNNNNNRNAHKISKGFELEGINFEVKLPGTFNLYNALLAVVTAHELGVDYQQAANALSSFIKIRGRMEEVKNNRGFRIFVDYGCEPVSIKAALLAANSMPHQRLIHVFGSTGGHRDVVKRFLFGQISARLADVIIITNDDVYDSDPERIADDIVEGIRQVESEKLKVKSVLRHLDRRFAIAEALKMAEKNDTVLITGKGSEQFLVLPGNLRVEWDEVRVVNEEIKKLGN